ncbi:hypothetical protein [Pseudomonas asplenii]|uniref:hypothetical protein n=1 Tax=Pseudomonas asplenii TaxID=53407 RepID=UPI0022345F62|nr:hypothetical protein [Pseudomonas asplenii]UZE28334.1 hypothetical protein LOY63_23875 [Pseudomonas asplenii]
MAPFNARPPVHLWVYNHSFYGISDQVDFLVMALQQQGYPVSVGKRPSDSRLNIVIENFSESTRDTLIDFCEARGKRVAVIMTEHLDFVDNQILIHGDPLWNNNDYMHPAVQVARIQHLFECLPHICAFLMLGDLPQLINMDQLLPGVPVRAIGFPSLPKVAPDPTVSAQSDLLFTGAVTDYRGRMLDMLRGEGFSIACPERFVSRGQRDALNRSARLVLNIPQRLDWRWLSLMRIIAALRVGKVTVSLGTADTSQIAACCPQINLEQPDWLQVLRDHVEGTDALYVRMHTEYEAMAARFMLEHPFPHDLFDYWQMIDHVPYSGSGDERWTQSYPQ